MHILVDTNVFLDFLLKREDYDNVKKFFLYCSELKHRIFISAMSLRDIEYVAHHVFHDKNKAKKIQMLAYQICFKVIGISDATAIEALLSDVEDYEDALLIETCRENLMDVIVTNNIKDFKGAHFPVFTPKELNNIWAKA